MASDAFPFSMQRSYFCPTSAAMAAVANSYEVLSLCGAAGGGVAATIFSASAKMACVGTEAWGGSVVLGSRLMASTNVDLAASVWPRAAATMPSATSTWAWTGGVHEVFLHLSR